MDADDAIDAIIEVCDKLSVRKKDIRAELYFRSDPSLFSIFRPTSKTSKLPYAVEHLVDSANRGELTERGLFVSTFDFAWEPRWPVRRWDYGASKRISSATRVIWPDGLYVTYGCDAVGSMTAIRESGAASSIGVQAGIAHDGSGRRTSLTLGNNVVQTYTFILPNLETPSSPAKTRYADPAESPHFSLPLVWWGGGCLFVRLIVLGSALLSASSAHAASVDPEGSGVIVNAARWLQGTLLGTVATIAAVIAVAAVGFMMLTGRMNWRYGAIVILGCFILFGAASIVAGIQSAATVG